MSDIVYRAMARADLQALCDLINEGHRYDGIPQALQVDELEEQLDDAGDLTENVRLAMSDDEIVGYVTATYLPSDVLWERCYVHGVVRPDQRGMGIGRELMQWGVDRGRHVLLSSPHSLPLYLRVEREEGADAVQRLFQHFGFREARVFEELLRPLTNVPPVPQIAGVRIAPWPNDRDADILAVKNVAFFDHWGSTPKPLDRWIASVRGFGAWAERSLVALDDEDRVVAYSLNHRYPADDELTGRRDGWIDNLGTLPEWRGRGIASALIVASLHQFVDAGLTHASIAVDSDSITGAARLYRSLGFEVHRRFTTLEIEVTRPA